MLKKIVKSMLGPRVCKMLIAVYHAYGRACERRQRGSVAPPPVAAPIEIAAPVEVAAPESVKLALVSADKIAQGLRDLGIKRGDWICVHASLSAFFGDGLVATSLSSERLRPSEYGRMILEMLFDLVEPDGLVMMPTDFAGDYVGAATSGKVLSINKGKSNRGTLTEMFRKMPGVYRSTSPIYTVSVKGTGLESEAENHWDIPYAMDVGTPWDTFARRGGKVILFGCGYDVNSFIHHPEYLLKKEYPLPVFHSDAHLFNVENVNGERKQVASFVHKISWKYGTVTKFCEYLQEKYGLYKDVEIEGRKIIVFEARRQTDALFAELAQGVTWYSAEKFVS